MKGILYGLGVGPGDPELLTLKAARLIREADVVFAPAGSGGPSRALAAAAAHVDGKRLIELDMEMRGDREEALAAVADTVLAELGEGCGVYLTEGDPSLYSTFRLLADALKKAAPALEVVVVPGVSSITSAAAAAGVPLAMGDQTLAIVPASAPLPLIDDAIATFDQTVLLKPSIRGQELAEYLGSSGFLEASVLVVEASRKAQRILRGKETTAEAAPYFSTWLVPGAPPAGTRGRVFFIGVGPGSPKHLTRRALSLLRHASLVVAADSLVAPEVIGLARSTVIRSSTLSLEEAVPPMIEAARRQEVVVRLHSGDPSVYGAIAEQMSLLREAGCAYEVVPGVSSAFAAAAALGVELTEPGGSQTLILTRHGDRVRVPASERLRDLAAHRSTLAIFLSAASIEGVQAELLDAGLDPETPAAIAYRVSWPDELVIRTSVSRIAHEVRARRLRRHTLILVGDALSPGSRRSRLYDSGHAHVYRRRSHVSAPALPVPPALVALTEPGARQARRLARSMPGAVVIVPERFAGRGEQSLGRAAERVPALFTAGQPLVLFMAVGAAVRLLAGAVSTKQSEPPVVVVDDAGHYAVCLLGGRSAGGNRLTEWVAAVLGAEAVVTTAAERLGRPAVDETIAALGWRLGDGSNLAAVEAAVVNGEPIGFFGKGLQAPGGLKVRRIRSLKSAASVRTGLAVTDRLITGLPESWVLIRPRRLCLGVGCSSNASPDQAIDATANALNQFGLSSAGIAEVATIDKRQEHPAVVEVARKLGARLVTFSPEQLERVCVPNPSVEVRRAVGTASVAEAAAVLASSGGKLLVTKRVFGPVTLAVAEAAR